MAIVAAIVGAVASLVGAGIKSDKARKDRINLQSQLQAENEENRTDRFLGLIGFTNATNQRNADILKYVLIAVVVLVIIIFWYTAKKKK